MACSNIILHQHVQNYPRTLFYYSIFLSMTVKSTLYFPVLIVGRNEHTFVTCLRVKVFTCNILTEYSVVHREWTLKHDYSTKTGTLFFMDFHSVRHFRTTFYLVIQILFNNFWFVRFFDLNNCSELKHDLTSWFVLFLIFLIFLS